MNNINLNDMEQIITYYLIANFIIFICLVYLILSVIFKRVLKNENKKNDKVNNKINKKRKKDIIEFLWEKDKESKLKTVFKRIFLAVLIILTSVYIFNSTRFIIDNIEVVKKVLGIK